MSPDDDPMISNQWNMQKYTRSSKRKQTESCSRSGFVIDKIVFLSGDASIWTVLYSFRMTAFLPFRVGGSDGSKTVSLFLLLLLPTGIVIYSCFFQGSTFVYSIAHILLPLTLLFRQKQVMFPCLLCIMALCTHFILMFAVIFIFTLSTKLQKSLSLSVSGCECRERTWTRFQWICQMFINKHTTNSECCFIQEQQLIS